MSDLTPDEQRALATAVTEWFRTHTTGTPESSLRDAIWRAARAYQAEQDAQVIDRRDTGDMTREDQEARRCAAAIRAKGLT